MNLRKLNKPCAYDLATGEEVSPIPTMIPGTELTTKVLTHRIVQAYCKFYATRLAEHPLCLTQTDGVWTLGIGNA